MRRETVIALLLAFPLLISGVLTGLWLDKSRSRAGLVPSPGRIPLGGFEPLVVDLLWLRANSYIGQRRFPEAVAAIRIATELQPRVPENWVILGHLLAWRTSESSGDPEVHWRWAREGIEVIERGLQHNPDDPTLLLELGNLYLVRVSERAEVALLAEAELGTPPTERAADAYWRLYGIRENPDTLLSYAESVRRLGRRLAERGDVPGGRRYLEEALGRLRSLSRAPGDAEYAPKIEEIERTIDELDGR